MSEAREAAQILRGLKKRVDQLEERQDSGGPTYIYRTGRDDEASSREAVITILRTSSGADWDADDWDRKMEWA